MKTPNENKHADGRSELSVKLACPFCGGNEISDGEVLTKYPTGKVTTQSECQSCKALGPEVELADGKVDYGSLKALSGWNRRVQANAKVSERPAPDRE